MLYVNFPTRSLFEILYTENQKKQIPEPLIFLSVQETFPFLLVSCLTKTKYIPS